MINKINNINNLIFKANSKKTKKADNAEAKTKQGYFATEQGMLSREMNVAAIYNIKHDIDKIRPKVKDQADMEIVYSDSIEMSKRWTLWTDPKTLEVYTVINKKNNPDGTKTARILNSNGDLIAEKDVQPKKIVIMDSNGTKYNFFGKKINHDDFIKIYMERYNPLIDVELYQFDDSKDSYATIEQYYNDILNRIKNGEKIDYISCSFGSCLSFKNIEEDKYDLKEMLELFFNLYKDKNKDIASIIAVKKIVNEILKSGTKIIFSSGNGGTNGLNAQSVLYDGAEFIGSLDENGKISDFSSSRNYTTGYEKGEYLVTMKDQGINITGKPGVDIPYSGTIFEEYAGKKFDSTISVNDNKSNDSNIEIQAENKCIIVKNITPQTSFTISDDGYLIPCCTKRYVLGTSYSTPVRTAKLALYDTMKEITS